MKWTGDAYRRNDKKRLIWISGCILGVVLIVAAVVLLINRDDSQQAKDASDTKSVIERVSDLYIVPQGETPTVAVIENVDKVADNKEFFENAIDGDYLLVYKKAKVALIYRAEAGKLVNAGPVTTDGSANAQQPQQ
jgi:hypothetical protein